MSQEVLAVVAGEKITQEDFDAFLQGVPREQQPYLSNPQFKEQCKEQLIALHLFAKEGEVTKLEETDEFKTALNNAKRDILAQMAMRNAVKDAAPTLEECMAYYDENQSEFVKGGTVSARHILVDSEEKCKEIMEMIEKGEKDFEEAAKEFSSCPSKANGGSLGEFGKGQMVKEFEDAAFNAEIGKLVGPVKTQFGYHLIKVDGKTEETAASFSEVQREIMMELMQEKQMEAYKAKVAEMKEKYLEK